jgi:hypothetical protein
MIKLIFPGVLPFFLGLLLLLPLGCEDKRRHGANNGIAVEEVSPPISAHAQPGEVATALLAALNRAQMWPISHKSQHDRAKSSAVEPSTDECRI